MNTLTSSFRSSVRRVPLASARVPRASLRSSFRKYSTEAPPPKSSNTALYATLALALAGGLGYYAYTSTDTAATNVKSGVQATKAALKFTPTKADYQKVTRETPTYIGSWNADLALRCTIKLPKRSMTPASTMVCLAVLERVFQLLTHLRWFLWTCSPPSGLARFWYVRQGIEDWWQVWTYPSSL